MNSCASWRRDAGPARQPEVAHPVGQPEVDHLGHRALVRGHVGRVLAEDARGRLAVDVGLAGERVGQVVVAGDVGEDPELDLAVVGGDERRVRRPGDERPPDAPAERRSGSGCSGGSGPTSESRPVAATAWWNSGVEPAVRPDQRRQRLDVRRPQLGVDPPVQHWLDDRVDAGAAPRGPRHRSSSRSSSAALRAGSARRTGCARAASGEPRVNSWPTSA